MKGLKTRPQRRMRNRVYRSQTPHRELSSLPQTEYARVAPPLSSSEKERRKAGRVARKKEKEYHSTTTNYQVTIKSPPQKGYSIKQQRNLTKASQRPTEAKKRIPKAHLIYNNSLSLLSKTTPSPDRWDWTQAKQRKKVTTFLLT